MDRNSGPTNSPKEQRGWDWFSLRLDDGRDLTLYLLGTATTNPTSRVGTLVARDGATRVLKQGEWSIREAESRTGDRTGTRYSSGWTIAVPGAHPALDVRAHENVSDLVPGLFPG